MSNPMVQLQEATIKAQCKTLRMPMVASQFGTLAEQAIREKQSHIGYLEALLLAEIEKRERNTIERRIREAHLLHVDLRKRIKRMFRKGLEETRQILGRVDLDHSELPNSEWFRQKSSKLPEKPKAPVTAAASVIALKLLLQLTQQNPCCKLM